MATFPVIPQCFKFFHSYPLFPVFIFLVFLKINHFSQVIAYWLKQLNKDSIAAKPDKIHFHKFHRHRPPFWHEKRNLRQEVPPMCIYSVYLQNSSITCSLLTLTLPEANIIEMKEFVIILPLNSFQSKDCYTKKQIIKQICLCSWHSINIKNIKDIEDMDLFGVYIGIPDRYFRQYLQTIGIIFW